MSEPNDRARTTSPVLSWSRSRRARRTRVGYALRDRARRGPGPAAERGPDGDRDRAADPAGERTRSSPGTCVAGRGTRRAGRHGGRLAHRGAFHAVRSPGYVVLAAGGPCVGFFVARPGRPLVVAGRADPAAFGGRRAGDAREWTRCTARRGNPPLSAASCWRRRGGPGRRLRGAEPRPWWGWPPGRGRAAAAGPGRAPGGPADHPGRRRRRRGSG